MTSRIEVIGRPLPDLYIIKLQASEDKRGGFTKIFNSETFKDKIIEFEPREIFYSTSARNVLRGMHFQKDDGALMKLVTCVRGRAIDVVVDYRKNSDYFNKPFSIELSGSKKIAILIGKQYAHGFYSLEDDTILEYITDKEYQHENDSGVLWSSISYDWPSTSPILSNRDKLHKPIAE